MRFEQLIGLRYLKSRHRNSISLITTIAILGVAVGVWALLVVISVMSGFEDDLRSKILNTNAHILVDGNKMLMEDSPEIMEMLAKDPDVIGTSPFLKSEVMLSSNTNLATVVMKGVHKDLAGQVNNLEQDLVEGRLEWLDDPESIRANDSDGTAQASGGQLEVALESGAEGKHLDKEEAAKPDTDSDIDTNTDSNERAIANLEGASNAETTPNAEPEFIMPPLPGPEKAQSAHPIIIGRELKRNLMVQLGDEITVVSPLGDLGPVGPTPKARTFRIAGIFFTGMYEYDTTVTYTSMEAARDFFDVGSQISGIEVRIKNLDKTKPAVARISKALPDSHGVRDWMQLNKSLFAALKLEKVAMFIVLTFIVLVASFNIISNLIMIVLEKAREIAILKSMGATNKNIRTIFMTEGVVIGVLGMILGLITGLGTCAFIAKIGIPIDQEVYYFSSLPVSINPLEVVLVCVAAVLISFLATIYPAVQAARLEPAEGLRYD